MEAGAASLIRGGLARIQEIQTAVAERVISAEMRRRNWRVQAERVLIQR
jgi:hypothetical protein